MDMQHWHWQAAGTYGMVMQQIRTTWTCSMEIQHGHKGPVILTKYLNCYASSSFGLAKDI
jgi:hypothetical protein